MIKLLLLSVLVVLSNAGVSCNSDGSCPFWCVTCGCCAGTCYFGADLSGCTSFQCQGCQNAAKAGIAAGSAAACDAAASSACMAAGGFDPIADAVCPAIITPLCLELFKDGTDHIDAFGACKAVGFCDDSDSPIDEVTVIGLGAPKSGEGEEDVSNPSGSGSGSGMRYQVMADKDGEAPVLILRHQNQTDELVELSISAGFDSYDHCSDYTEGKVHSEGLWQQDFVVAFGCNEVGAVAHDGSFVPMGYSVGLQCKGDGSDTMIQSFYHTNGECNGVAEEINEVLNGNCTYAHFDYSLFSWSNYNCSTGEEVQVLETAPPTSAPTAVADLRPHCENLDQRFCRRFKSCQWTRTEDGSSKTCVVKATSDEECYDYDTKNRCRSRGCSWNRKHYGRARCTAKPAACDSLTSSKTCKRKGCVWNKRQQKCH